MLDFSQMLVRFLASLVLGGLVGLEREAAGKEAGIGTSMAVSGGAALFTLIALALPYLVATPETSIADIIARNSGFLGIIANIVVGVGFLGAGIIMKTEERVHGLTTAAVIWVVAAVGTLAGLGMFQMSAVAAALLALILFSLRKLAVSDIFLPLRPKKNGSRR